MTCILHHTNKLNNNYVFLQVIPFSSPLSFREKSVYHHNVLNQNLFNGVDYCWTHLTLRGDPYVHPARERVSSHFGLKRIKNFLLLSIDLILFLITLLIILRVINFVKMFGWFYFISIYACRFNRNCCDKLINSFISASLL